MILIYGDGDDYDDYDDYDDDGDGDERASS